MKKKNVLLILIAVLCVALLAGCGNKEEKAKKEAYEKAVNAFNAYLDVEKEAGMVVNHNMVTVVDDIYMFQIKDNVVVETSVTKVEEKDGHFVPIYNNDETPAITEDMCAFIRDVDLLKYEEVVLDSMVVQPSEGGDPSTTTAGWNAIYGLPEGSVLYDGVELRPINASLELDGWNPSFCCYKPT